MKQYPLIKFVILFISGIILQKTFQFDLDLILFSTLSILIVSVAVLFVLRNELRMILLNIILPASIVLIGIFYLGVSNINEVSYPFSKYKNTNTYIFGTITDIELLREESIIFTVDADSMIIEKDSLISRINVLCRIYDDSRCNLDSLYSIMKIGNAIMLKGTLQKARNKRNPGEFDYYNYLASQNISAICNSYKVGDLQIIKYEASFLKNTLFNIRKFIDLQIEKLHTREAAALIKGLILADRSKIDYETRESFVNAGVVHVLAVSGLHVGFIILIFLFLFGRLNVYLRYILTIAGIIFFLLITGWPPSVFRASVMAITMLAAFLSSRSYNSINSLALAAFLLLLINPNELFNPGFQLSFSAVLSIVLIYPFFRDIVNNMKLKSALIRYFLLFFGVSMSAQIGTLPFTLIYFHKLSVVALFANLLVIPLIGIILGISILTIIVGSIWTWLGFIYGSASNIFVEFLFIFVDVIGSLKISHIYINQFSLFDTIIFYSAIIISFYFVQRFVTLRAKIILVILMLMNTLIFISLDNHEILENGKLSVMAIDVGQGDAIFIKFPDGTTALIDAGDSTEHFDNGKRIIVPLLRYMGVEKIDYGFITHLDSDHYGGYISLLESGIVEKLYKPPVDSTSEKSIIFENFLKSISIQNKSYTKECIEIGNSRIYVLNTASSELYNSFDSNDKSGILKIIYGNTSFLLVGDAGHKSEDLLVNTYRKFLEADVLKVGHHGSKNSSADHFLAAVNPSIAIISAGIQNKFKHPSPVVLKKLERINAKIKRTDYEGAVLFQSDGESITGINWRLDDRNFISNY